MVVESEEKKRKRNFANGRACDHDDDVDAAAFGERFMEVGIFKVVIGAWLFFCQVIGRIFGGSFAR